MACQVLRAPVPMCAGTPPSCGAAVAGTSRRPAFRRHAVSRSQGTGVRGFGLAQRLRLLRIPWMSDDDLPDEAKRATIQFVLAVNDEEHQQ
jgi:hypothetical protein